MAAMRAVDADYAGIDLIRTADGELQVLEVNSNPAWRGLQSVADINIAWAIAEDFLKTVVAASCWRRASRRRRAMTGLREAARSGDCSSPPAAPSLTL